MPFTRTFEPLRPLQAPDNGGAYAAPMILSTMWRVYYGHREWPSASYWLVPNTGWD